MKGNHLPGNAVEQLGPREGEEGVPDEQLPGGEMGLAENPF